MVPINKVKDIITKYDSIEKELSSGNIDSKLFAKKSKEYSSLGGIIEIARKYVNFRVGGSPYKETDAYTVWTNDLLGKVIASKTIIQPGQSTEGHKLIDSDVVYVVVNGRGRMEVVEYMNSEEGHGGDPSYGVEHQDSYDLVAGDVILVQSGDYVKVSNKSEHDQLAYLRIFDREGWRDKK